MWCGEWTIQSGHLTFHASFIGGGRWGGKRGFIFLSANKRAQVRGGQERFFFFSFPCFLMCSHDVPFKFLMGSHNVPQVHNVFPNMFSIYKHFTFSPYALALSPIQLGPRGRTIYIKIEPFILSNLHSFIFLRAMGKSNWFWPKIFTQFVDESEHSGRFTN